MSLRKRYLFALLFMTVALIAARGMNDSNAGSDAPKPSPWLRAPVPPSDPAPWYGGQPSNKPSPRLKAFRTKSELAPASLLPIQFKDPKNLGVGKLLVASRGLGDPNLFHGASAGNSVS